MQIDEIAPPAYTDLSRICVFYIKKLKFQLQYMADMLIDLADAIMTSYTPGQEKNLLYNFL